MANRLTMATVEWPPSNGHRRMATVDTILTLHTAGHSQREIARLTGVHRETVRRYVAQATTEASAQRRPFQRRVRGAARAAATSCTT